MRRWQLVVGSLILFTVAAGTMASVPTGSDDYAAGPDSTEVRMAVMNFIGAIDRLDLEGVVNSFADDATAFYPFSFTGRRLNGRAEIRAAQSRAFEWARKQFGADAESKDLSLKLNPTDMRIHILGENAASVTWHSNRPSHYGRRSATLEKRDGRWLIVSHHASNMDRPPGGAD